MKSKIILTAILAAGVFIAKAQKPEDTEVWSPEPPVVTPGAACPAPPPSDAIVLFDGSNQDQWVMAQDRDKPADWFVKDGIWTVNKAGGGNVETKKSFTNYQLHVEWRVPSTITG